MFSCQARGAAFSLQHQVPSLFHRVVNTSPREPHLGKGITAKEVIQCREVIQPLECQLPSAGEEEVLGESGVRIAESPDYVGEMVRTDKGYAEARP